MSHKGMWSLSKLRPDKVSIQSNTEQNRLRCPQDARVLGYGSLFRALIQPLVKNGSESKDFLQRLFPFRRFKESGHLERNF